MSSSHHQGSQVAIAERFVISNGVGELRRVSHRGRMLNLVVPRA
ncbi:hypothetical protein Pd630_LPD03859 [Rhodococcus opacus PD630]|nr:hypothetical protein Pd630_LPD03859 [Rhodococcus opacus PD630]